MPVRLGLAFLLAAALAGCGSWHYTVNAPLARYDAFLSL